MKEFFQHSIHWPLIVCCIVLTAATLRWLFSNDAMEDDTDKQWTDVFRENKRLLELCILVPLVAFIITYDFRHLPEPLRHIISQCTADAVADVLYVIRWPLMVISVLCVLWIVWSIYFRGFLAERDVEDLSTDMSPGGSPADYLMAKYGGRYGMHIARFDMIKAVVFCFAGILIFAALGVRYQLLLPPPHPVTKCVSEAKASQ